jgi:hypothetical protein
MTNIRKAYLENHPNKKVLGSESQLQKNMAMWFFVSNNFDVKLETLILLDKIQLSRFSIEELSKFILMIETEMLKEMSPGDSTQESEGVNLTESIALNETEDGRLLSNDRPLEESYRSLNFEKMGMQNTFPNEFVEEGTTTDISHNEFEALDMKNKKEWILAKIMQLNISKKVQNQLVDRFDLMIKMEDQIFQEQLDQLQYLETQLEQAKEKNSLTIEEENMILNQLEEKEKQLLSIDYEYKQAKDKLISSEREKKKLEENFVSEVLGLQTELDQKLIQIQNLDQRNKELMDSKRNFEQMITEYKEYSDNCKNETKEVRESKNNEIKKLKNELNWVKENNNKEKQAFLQKVEVEKIALEQTIRELIYKNKVKINRIYKKILIILKSNYKN